MSTLIRVNKLTVMHFKHVSFRKGKGANIPSQAGPIQRASLSHLSSVLKNRSRRELPKRIVIFFQRKIIRWNIPYVAFTKCVNDTAVQSIIEETIVAY